jgi:hypothetical protein
VTRSSIGEDKVDLSVTATTNPAIGEVGLLGLGLRAIFRSASARPTQKMALLTSQETAEIACTSGPINVARPVVALIDHGCYLFGARE